MQNCEKFNKIQMRFDKHVSILFLIHLLLCFLLFIFYKRKL